MAKRKEIDLFITSGDPIEHLTIEKEEIDTGAAEVSVRSLVETLRTVQAMDHLLIVRLDPIGKIEFLPIPKIVS